MQLLKIKSILLRNNTGRCYVNQYFFLLEIGTLFLKSISTVIITFSELDWITCHQSNFTRLEESIAIKPGRVLDVGTINISYRLNSLLSFYFINEV